MPLIEEDTLAFGEEEIQRGKDGSLTHPYVTFFHVFFRTAALVLYLLCELFSKSFITSFVIVVLLLSMDFWTVKNITGRLMVGLRWWNYVDDKGKSHWVYESRKGQLQMKVNERESRIFWTMLIVIPLIWGLFFFVALLRFEVQWLLLVIIALLLNFANIHGYIRCKVGNKQSLGSLTTDFFKQQVLQNAVSLVTQQAANPQSNPVAGGGGQTNQTV